MAMNTQRAHPAPAATRAGRPLRRDAAANRERLLTAATAVFNDEGLDAGVELIAQRAGVGIGTLYRRFPNKDALIRQLVDGLLEDLLTAANVALETTDGHGLEAYVRRVGALQASHRGYLSQLWESGSPQLIAALREAHATLLRTAQNAGVIRSDITTTDLALLMWSLRGIVEMTAGHAPGAWQRHLDITFAGMRPHAAVLAHPPISSAEAAAASAGAQRPAVP
jgi:AcrR family transcriptional regulator